MNIPQRKPRDKEKYRQQYLANLQLENSNNTLNLNASKMYKATGASSQVASTMTGAEKLAGFEGLKQIAKDHLVSFRFANPLSAQEAVDGMNEMDIKFLNEYAQFISTDFKGRNVPGRVITAYIKKLRRKMEETENVDYGVQQHSGAGILLTGSGDVYSQNDIQEIGMRCQQAFSPQITNEIFSLMNKINRQASGINLERAKREGPERYALALKANSAFRENAPTVEQLLQMIEDDDPVAVISALQGAGRIDDYVASVGEEASNGPVSENAPIGTGESGVEGIGGVGEPLYASAEDRQMRIQGAMISFMNLPAESKVEVLRELGVDTASFTTEDELNNAFYQAISAQISASEPSQPFSSGFESAEASATASPLSPSSVSPLGSPTGESAFGSPTDLPERTPIGGGDPDFQANRLDRLVNEVYNKGTALDSDVLEPGSEEVREIRAGIEDFWQYAQQMTPASDLPPIQPIIQQLDAIGLTSGKDFILRWLGDTYMVINPLYQQEVNGSPATESPASFGSPSTLGSSQSTADRLPGNAKSKPPPVSAGNEVGKGRGIKGKGVGKVIPQGSALHRVDKYDKPKPYKQFGRHIIHRRKLDDGIMMIKYPSGAKHPDMPTQKISEGLTKVLKEMADGRMPQYHHFEGLGVKDKELLHHIVRHTQFQDLQVPPPDKEALDKELDRFEILKGEIEAGNDNKELIREFKVMLMKFMRQGRIPKAQVNEIMEHLLMMGH